MKRIITFALLAMLFTVTQAAKKIKVSCVGNSITYGYLLPDPATQSYPSRLQVLLGDKYEVGNFGKSGATLLNKGYRPYMKQEEYTKAMAFAGDVVVIHLGVNDTDPRAWPNYRDEFVRNYLQLIDSLRSVNPKARVIVCKLTPLSSRHYRFLSGTRDWREQINQYIEVVAKYAKAEIIDLGAALYPHHNLLHDAIHPDKEGAQIIANTVYKGITGNYGGLKMPMLYTDNMVLQRNQPLQISGTADTGTKVTVSVAGQKVQAVAGTNGKFVASLEPLKAGGPYTLEIKANRQKLTYRNVMVGEVWVCSGQSNMEFMLKQASTASRDVAKANDANIRLFDMKVRWRTNDVEWSKEVLDSVNKLDYFLPAQWQTCTPQTAADFSAVAYYFGKMLSDSLQVPVGLICNAVGGSPIGTWIDRKTLEHEMPAKLNNWIKNDFLQDWVRARATKNLGKEAPALQRHPYEPCYLFESGMLPLKGYQVKGVIWYQGESNAHNKEAFSNLFPLLVNSWRTFFKQETLPFYYVQLSSLNRQSWPWFRDTQRLLLDKIENTGMVVSTDCGDSLDVHPVNKQPVGERLARWALNKQYGFTKVTPSGPLFTSAVAKEGAVYVRFNYSEGLKTSDGKAPITFEVAEDDGMYYPADAEIVGNEIRLTSKEVVHPRLVRYGWQPFTRANLVNKDGLPASTFKGEVKE